MMKLKEAEPVDEVVHYNPRHLIEGDAAEYEPNSKVPNQGQYKYQLLDALYHYFDPEPHGDNDDPKPDTEGERPDSLVGHSEAIAKLLSGGFYLDAGDDPLNACALRTEVGFTQFRDSTTFIGGEVTRGHLPQIRRWCYSHLGNAVYLDATGYSDEWEVGKEQSAFEQLMSLAGRTKEVIDDGICKNWPTNSKAVMNFINANQTDSIYSTNRVYADGEQVETKWLIEGRFLAEELIKIPGFQQNFNKLVIFGAMRYILAGEINLNKLYRLMAKLGRINTKLYFVG